MVKSTMGTSGSIPESVKSKALEPPDNQADTQWITVKEWTTANDSKPPGCVFVLKQTGNQNEHLHEAVYLGKLGPKELFIHAECDQNDPDRGEPTKGNPTVKIDNLLDLPSDSRIRWTDVRVYPETKDLKPERIRNRLIAVATRLEAESGAVTAHMDDGRRCADFVQLFKDKCCLAFRSLSFSPADIVTFSLQRNGKLHSHKAVYLGMFGADEVVIHSVCNDEKHPCFFGHSADVPDDDMSLRVDSMYKIAGNADILSTGLCISPRTESPLVSRNSLPYLEKLIEAAIDCNGLTVPPVGDQFSCENAVKYFVELCDSQIVEKKSTEKRKRPYDSCDLDEPVVLSGCGFSTQSERTRDFLLAFLGLTGAIIGILLRR